MKEESQQATQIINVRDVLPDESVSSVETIRVMWAIRIALIALGIATAALFYDLYQETENLQSWATGLISAIAGAAITYGFNARGTS